MSLSKIAYLPPTIDQTYHRARRRWQWALMTPLLYLLLAQWARHRGWIVASPDAPPVWDRPDWWGLAGALAAGTAVGMVVLRRRQRTNVLRLKENPGQALHRWMIDFYLLAGLADILAFLGLIAFCLSGRFDAVLAGGVAAYMGYIVAHPRRRDLVGLDEPLGDVDDSAF